MSAENLEQLLRQNRSAVHMLRNSQMDAFVYPVVATEFSNWRNEQRAWAEKVVLLDQCHHMAELLIEGPDAVKLVSETSVNTYKNFRVDKGKQFVAVSHSGHVIGDNIMFYLDENKLLLVGRPPSLNWVNFHAKTGGYDVTAEFDPSSPPRPNGHAVTRRHYRYQIQGKLAPQLLEKLNGGPIGDVKFFDMTTFRIGGRTIRALRHSMSGVPGLEFWGPYEQREEIRDIIMEAGKEFDLHLVGSRAYSTNALESGWIPSPLPAVYTDERMRSYREWLPADGYEAKLSIGGSFASDDIEDYYRNPFDMGYGHILKFDHDFIGREALEKIADQPHRRKVTLVWNADDVARIQRSMLDPEGENYKYLEMPLSNYAASNYDRVERNGKLVGLSMFTGYTYNERTFISLATVDPDVELGEELVLIWGEENGGTRKRTVEPHKQTEVRVRVAPAPFTSAARETYVTVGWRAASAA